MMTPAEIFVERIDSMQTSARRQRDASAVYFLLRYLEDTLTHYRLLGEPDYHFNPLTSDWERPARDATRMAAYEIIIAEMLIDELRTSVKFVENERRRHFIEETVSCLANPALQNCDSWAKQHIYFQDGEVEHATIGWDSDRELEPEVDANDLIATAQDNWRKVVRRWGADLQRCIAMATLEMQRTVPDAIPVMHRAKTSFRSVLGIEIEKQSITKGEPSEGATQDTLTTREFYVFKFFVDSPHALSVAAIQKAVELDPDSKIGTATSTVYEWVNKLIGRKLVTPVEGTSEYALTEAGKARSKLPGKLP